ncbi:MAG: hypothetical protein ACT4P7_09245 [Gemmatimonadaceae bacterium]
MPSAARAFTPDVVDRLVHMGVRVALIVLHAGVSSLEADEPPYPEGPACPPQPLPGLRTPPAQRGSAPPD